MEEIMTYDAFLRALIRGVEEWEREGNFDEYVDGLDIVANLDSYLSPEDLGDAERLITGIKRMVFGMSKGGTSIDVIVGKVIGKLSGEIGKSAKKKKKKKVKSVDVVSIVDASNAYERLCRYDAVYDLLTCNLHRLDPVIGDYGCQWRVPFILDLYDHARGQLLGGVIEDEGALLEALDAYAAYRATFLSYDTLSDIFTNAGRDKSNDFQDEAVLNFISGLAGFEDALSENCSGFAAIINWFANTLAEGWQGLPNAFDAYEYLMLCKLLTIGRIRMMDVFGLSARFNLSRNLPHSKSTIRPAIENLAFYSKIYMRHVTQSVCLAQGLEIDGDTDLAIHEGDHAGHIAASCSDLMQIGRYQTRFNGQEFETHLFYGPFRSIFMHQHAKGQPIIVDIRRLVCQANPQGNEEDGTQLTYSLNGGAILYFEPDANGDGFVYVPNPTEDQKNTVGMCVECFSVLNLSEDQVVTDGDGVFYTQDFDAYIDLVTNQCSIFDLIMIGGACHDETPQVDLYFGDDGDLPLNSVREYNEQVERNYRDSVRGGSIYDGITVDIPLTSRSIPFIAGAETPLWDIIIERNALRSLAGKFRMDSVAYVNKKNVDRRKYRNAATVPLAPIHIYGCTYAIKVQELAEMQARNNEETIVTGWVINPDDCMPKHE